MVTTGLKFQKDNAYIAIDQIINDTTFPDSQLAKHS